MAPQLGDALRNLRIGLQATVDTPPATMYAVPVTSGDHGLNREREVTEQLFGTWTRAFDVRQRGEHDTFNLSTYLFYDWYVYLLAAVLGMPVTANHSGETTVKDHVFIEKGNAPLVCIEFDDGLQWWRMLNCRGNSLTIDQPTQAVPTGEAEFLGDIAEPIATPGDLGLALADYFHPDWLHLMLKLNGVAADIMGASVTINRNLTPRFVGNRSASPKRFVKGPTEITFEVQPDYTTDTGSLFKRWRDNAIPQSIELEWVSLADEIGVGPSNPTFSLLVPKAGLAEGQHQINEVPVETPISGSALYDATTGGAVKFTLTNEIAAVATS